MPLSLRTHAAALIAALSLTGACGGGTSLPDAITKPTEPPPPRPTLSDVYRPTGHAAAGDVAVHLFDWRWNDIATECETVLGPAGVQAVQVSPPNEHSITPSHDWSERYQPVSYSVERSRSGTGAEFRAMVSRCKAAGVGIIVDAVINHMTNFPSPGTGSNGSSYTKYSYPGLYVESDFHTPCALNDYNSPANVQDCELLGLPDLNTASPSVRNKIAAYLIALSRMDVAGYRVDAAKHIQQVDLDSIMAIVHRTLAGEGRPLPYWYLEVVAGNGEALTERDYFGEGYDTGGAADITEFTFTGVADKFTRLGGQMISDLNPNGPAGRQFSAAAWGLIPSDKALVFLQNHDTQHSCGLSYRDAQTYRLAHVWMLAQPYGYPLVLSSFAFNCPSGNSMGPPSDADGWTLPVTCATSMESASVGQWVCEHRDPYIRRMVRFRRVVAGTSTALWWDNGANAIAFSRGDKGFVAINRESSGVSATVATGLAPGTYCDRITGGKVSGACAGTSITIAANSSVQLTLPANSAIAVDVETKL